MADQLEKSIVATIAYFDVFEYPVSLLELHRLLLGRRTAPSVLVELNRALQEGRLLAKAIRRKDAFFYSRGRERLVDTRHTRFLAAEEKYKQSRRLIRLLSYVPFVRGLFVCNSMALLNAIKTSDIDLVVITKPKGTWWARLFCLLVLSALRRRPGQPGGTPKICLSMFIDEDHLNIGNLRMGENDIDFAYWVANFYPIYSAREVYQRFWAANATWLSSTVPNVYPVIPHPSRVVQHREILRPFVERLLAPFTAFARDIQWKKFPSAIRDLANRDTRVRVEEGILKFHTNDRRVEHLESFIKRYEALLSLRA
ncbi:hypothetical protein BK004_02325 [bacterium CG10_46_32]|nr:MAG: hypothetical protein BK004_02325 [bacterium CG10_46_32]PIR56150.1 MAG: hypothetical protein COU73_02345 [Parcubacteria group bacterium CG10_big_fil_rev_8_21_14_0_10_46_32]